MNNLINALISEKSMRDASLGRFTFKVTMNADKNSIKAEIEKRFKVNVVKVSTVVTKGRSVRAGVRRNELNLQPFKKAIVTLKKGQTIGLFDAGTQK